MIPARTPLLAESTIAKRRSFYDAHRVERKDLLDKPRGSAEGVKQDRFGIPHHGAKIRYVPRPGGELRTEPRAPTGPEREGYKHRRGPQHSSLNLPRAPLLLDDLGST